MNAKQSWSWKTPQLAQFLRTIPGTPSPHVSMRVLAALSRGSVIPALPLLTELQLASLNIFPIGKANRKAAERETQRKECLCPPSSILTGKMPQRKLPLLMPFRVQNPGRQSNSTCSWSMSIMVWDFCHFSASNTKSFSIQPQGLIALNSHLKRNTGPWTRIIKSVNDFLEANIHTLNVRNC